jgi:hypothetical protein
MARLTHAKKMLPPLKNFDNPSNHSYNRPSPFSLQQNIEAENRSLEIKNRVLEDLLKERDALIDCQNSEIKVLKNALLQTARHEERLKFKISESFATIKELEARLQCIPEITDGVEIEETPNLDIIKEELLAIKGILGDHNQIDCSENLHVNTEKIYKSDFTDFIFQTSNIPDESTTSSSRTAEEKPELHGILKNSMQKKLPEVLLKSKKRRSRQDSTTKWKTTESKIIPHSQYEIHGATDPKARSPSTTKSMIIKERDDLEEELLIQYERLRILNT